jgi:hypothetical protein
MAEIHGEVVNEQFTGNYDRRCWSLDPLESGSWAAPLIGQHELYLPEYFKTHNNVRFEHHLSPEPENTNRDCADEDLQTR